LEGKKRFTVAKKGSHLEKWVTLGKREVSLGIKSQTLKKLVTLKQRATLGQK